MSDNKFITIIVDRGLDNVVWNMASLSCRIKVKKLAILVSEFNQYTAMNTHFKPMIKCKYVHTHTHTHTHYMD